MEQTGPISRRRSDGSVRECLFFPVLERNETQRLEAMTQVVLERSPRHEARLKRWTWGGESGQGGTLWRRENGAGCGVCNAGQQLGNERVDALQHQHWDVAGDMLGGDKGPSSSVRSSPVRHPESPATPSRRSSPRPLSQSLGTPRRSSKSRNQSPCASGLPPSSPLKNGSVCLVADLSRMLVGEGREAKVHGSVEKKPAKAEGTEKKSLKSVGKERGTAAERTGDASPMTPTGKAVAGTTDAEEASRLLAERRRQARQQKEQEERQRREQEEEERLRAEEQRQRQEEEKARQEEAARQAEEQRQREELQRRRAEEEEQRLKEQRWKELQAHLEREARPCFIIPLSLKKEMEIRAQKEAERHQQEREMLRLQEDEERLQRKKRIEEIMRRTRKTTTETKKDAVWPEPPSPVSHVQSVSSPLLGLRAGTGPTITQASERNLEQLPSSFGLGLLEVQSGGTDEFFDEVQAMDVSPVAKEELNSISPVITVHNNGTNNAPASTLEHLLDMTGQVSCPKLSSREALGDCNKNLIEDLCPSAEHQLIQSFISSAEKLNLQ
ncbi:MAP7 domain-containing protein 2 isoform X1 [Arapaima gigas]